MQLKLPLLPKAPGRLGDSSFFLLYGILPLKFHLDDQKLIETFLVAKIFQYDVVLGYLWWVKNDLQINYKEGTFQLGQDHEKQL